MNRPAIATVFGVLVCLGHRPALAGGPSSDKPEESGQSDEGHLGLESVEEHPDPPPPNLTNFPH